MSVHYVLAPQAAIDIVEIWRYIKEQVQPEADVKFFPVYSYLIVHQPETTPLQIASILHGRRDLEQTSRDAYKRSP